MTAVDTSSQLRVVTVGHVDHGKSTLIGRLLHDTGNLPDGKVAELQRASERRGVAFEWSFVLDALRGSRIGNIQENVVTVFRAITTSLATKRLIDEIEAAPRE